MNSKVKVLVGLILLVMLTGCLVPGRHGEPVLLVPPHPSIEVVGDGGDGHHGHRGH